MGSIVSTALVVVGTAITGGAVWGTAGFWATVATGSAMIATGIALSPKPKIASLGNQSYSSQATNRSLMVKQPITNREMVYGATKKSGSILFMDTTNNNKNMITSYANVLVD